MSQSGPFKAARQLYCNTSDTQNEIHKDPYLVRKSNTSKYCIENDVIIWIKIGFFSLLDEENEESKLLLVCPDFHRHLFPGSQMLPGDYKKAILIQKSQVQMAYLALPLSSGWLLDYD